MIKILVVLCDKEKTLMLLFQKYSLNYKIVTNGSGTATAGILEYFGLNQTKKKIFMTLIPSELEENILKDIKKWFNIEKQGKGIAFTISLTSSSAFIRNNINKGDIIVDKKNEYELIITIVQEGYSEIVMNSAKSAGCSGGTVIHGRSLGSRGTIFMDLSIEPSKELVLNIVKSNIKKNVMERITRDCGVKTEARGVLISIPLDNVIGLQE